MEWEKMDINGMWHQIFGSFLEAVTNEMTARTMFHCNLNEPSFHSFFPLLNLTEHCSSSLQPHRTLFSFHSSTSQNIVLLPVSNLTEHCSPSTPQPNRTLFSFQSATSQNIALFLPFNLTEHCSSCNPQPNRTLFSSPLANLILMNHTFHHSLLLLFVVVIGRNCAATTCCVVWLLLQISPMLHGCSIRIWLLFPVVATPSSQHACFQRAISGEVCCLVLLPCSLIMTTTSAARDGATC